MNIKTEIKGAVGIATLNRPEALNALNTALLNELADALEAWDRDDKVRCIIVTGSDRAFAAGADIKEMQPKTYSQMYRENLFGDQFDRIARVKKPIIAAVDGYALAGGMELALSCDLIVANAGAKFGIPEAKRGLAAGAGGLIKLPRQIPPRIAMELALTGDFIDAKRAYELGFINRIAEGPSLDAAKELAARIAENGPLALIASKGVIRDSHTWTDAEMWDKQQEYIGPVFASNDAREGATAFAEKRKPNWTGA